MKLWVKRIAIFFFVMFLLLFTAVSSYIAGVASGLFASSEAGTLTEEVISGEEAKAKIGILRLEGLILSSGAQSPFSSSGIISAKQVKSWLREIQKDPDTKALILEVNSPGGSPVASDEIFKAISAFRQSGKTGVVVMEDTATSGAYFFSAAADRIIASPATLTGSIGVIAEIPNLEELLAKIGIDIEVYKSGEYKDITSLSRSRSEEEQALIQEYIDAAFNLFVDRVAEGREMPRSKVLELAKGQAFSGVKAKELGLIDELGSVEDAVEEAKLISNLTEVKIVRYRTETTLDILFGRVGGAVNPIGQLINQLTTPGLRVFYLPSF